MQSRSMRWIGVVAAVVGSIGSACSSAEPPPAAAESATTAGADFSFDASAASQSALGIASWKGVTNEEQTSIRGVDASGKAMLTAEGRIYDESGIHHVWQQVTQNGKTATFDLQTKTLDGEPAVRIKTTNADAPNALTRALELMLADLNASESTAVLSGSTASTASLGFRDVALTQNNQCSFLQNCANVPLLQVTSAVGASLSCTVAAPLIAVDEWTSVTDFLSGKGFNESIKDGIKTSDCVKAFGDAWKNNDSDGPLKKNCEKSTANGCPIPRDTPCYPGCKSGLECSNGECVIASQPSAP